MPDKEKFMYAAICFGNDARHDCRECDYYIRTNCVEYCDERRIVRDALALLKEQDNCENCAIAIEDRQPVVRCKDCKHCVIAEDHVWRSLRGETLYKCEHIPLIDVESNWFCADGERK